MQFPTAFDHIIMNYVWKELAQTSAGNANDGFDAADRCS